MRVTWYYRPEELELDSRLEVEEHEIFATEEEGVHPLEAVVGSCRVVTPQQLAVGPALQDANVFVCSRKYIPSEG